LTQHPTSAADLDPRFVFDYTPLDLPEADTPDRRPTTYWDVERGNRGPAPVPDWVVTDAGAVDTDLGVLKTGKEADVVLVERAATDGSGHTALMAAKRYRSEQHRSFHRAAVYTEGRRTRRSRDARALERRSAYGRRVATGQWAHAEWDALKRYWSLGLPVPYPVQLRGSEILMEFVGDASGAAAPRLAEVRPGPERIEGYYTQLARVVVTLAGHGVAHGDLSAYNVLAEGDDIVVIDLPQVVDLVANPQGLAFLHRDCVNVCAWFRSRGLDVDGEALFAEAVAELT
jgi:RIO kinase 1